MTTGHLPQHWIEKVCVLLSVDGWREGYIPREAIRLFTAWARAEGGTANWDPLNTTDHITEGGAAWQATDYNGVGVANYTSPFHGIVATAATLLNGHYDGIVKALRGLSKTPLTAEQIVTQHEAEFKTWGTNPTTILQVLKTLH